MISCAHMFWKMCFVIVTSFQREPGPWALERAKKNVLENFLLVGILEELEDVLLLLERLLPHFFSDVLSIYKSPGGALLYGLCFVDQYRIKVKVNYIDFCVLA